MTTPVTYPWEMPIDGPAADFAVELRDALPVLTTERLTLRPPTLADFDPYREILMSERAVHMGGPMTREGAWRDFAQCTATWLLRGHGPWVIEETATARVLGFTVICMEVGDREPELGWFLIADAEGRGFAGEAAQAAKAHGIRTLGLPSLVSYIDGVNTRSTALAARIGGWPDESAAKDLGVEGVVVYRHWPLPDTDGGMEAYA